MNNNTVVDNTVPTIALTGTPAQNLVTVFEAGIASLEANMDNPANAAKGLETIMTNYKISELRENLEQKKKQVVELLMQRKRMKDGMEKYKELALKISSRFSSI